MEGTPLGVVLRSDRRKAIRVKCIGILPSRRIALDQIGRNIDFSANRNEIFAQVIVFERRDGSVASLGDTGAWFLQ
jgi:hypothetical protein